MIRVRRMPFRLGEGVRLGEGADVIKPELNDPRNPQRLFGHLEQEHACLTFTASSDAPGGPVAPGRPQRDGDRRRQLDVGGGGTGSVGPMVR
ncbi:hypothetical protein MF672_037560 [Actinomadura sp. ATCC 31491]|uniref:Uncharacterized protein n=1 Tax=Actinomadura luzonensis TaxID=2805427 RepID=A0ABT0G4N5_9ACTN|nr:hypothetical protein [Actinomadura luzonensis]MCK2219464.1 hypothetical protein [Actinomadura luzonensis]